MEYGGIRRARSLHATGQENAGQTEFLRAREVEPPDHRHGEHKHHEVCDDAWKREVAEVGKNVEALALGCRGIPLAAHGPGLEDVRDCRAEPRRCDDGGERVGRAEHSLGGEDARVDGEDGELAESDREEVGELNSKEDLGPAEYN